MTDLLAQLSTVNCAVFSHVHPILPLAECSGMFSFACHTAHEMGVVAHPYRGPINVVRLIFMAHNDTLSVNHFNILIVYSSASEVLKKRMTFAWLVLHFFGLISMPKCGNVTPDIFLCN